MKLRLVQFNSPGHILIQHKKATCPFRSKKDGPGKSGRHKSSGKSAKRKSGSGLTIPRWFTREGEDPFDQVEWELRSAKITNEQGEIVFETDPVDAPVHFSFEVECGAGACGVYVGAGEPIDDAAVTLDGVDFSHGFHR